MCCSIRAGRGPLAEPYGIGDTAGMKSRPALPFRLLQRGLKAVSRAGSQAVDRVLRSDTEPGPVKMPSSPQSPVHRAVSVRFTGENAVEVEVEWDSTLLEAARRADVELRSYCGGNCSCGTCRIQVMEGAKNLSKMESMEAFVLGEEHARNQGRLACQTRVKGPVQIHIPEWF